MNITTDKELSKFENTFLDQEVFIKLTDHYLPNIHCWIDSNTVYKGKLLKYSRYYYLENEYSNPNSLLYGYTFSTNRIKEIELVNKPTKTIKKK